MDSTPFPRHFIAAFGLLIIAVSGAAQDLTVMVPADDGTGLKTLVYLPEGDGPWPTLLVRTPYAARPDTTGRCDQYADVGYACVTQFMRGLQGSEGEWTWPLEGVDGRATIRWIIQQPRCDGRIGTFGESAMGVAQYRLAPDAPQEFVCMAPRIASPDTYHHEVFQGGAFREDLIVGGAEGLGIPESVGVILGHRLLDWWWAPMQAINGVDLVRVPGLHIGGWYDIFSQGTLDGFSALQADGGDGAHGRQYLIMTPTNHSGGSGHLFYPEDSRIDRDAIERAWMDACVRGDSNEVEEWPKVRVYLMGAAWSPFGIPQEDNAPGNVWLTLDRWPPPSEPLHYYLTGNGSLTEDVSPIGELTLIIDPSDPVPTDPNDKLVVSSDPRDLRAIESRNDVLVFTTDALTTPVTVIGRVTCRLWVRPDTTDLDLAVRLSDVYPTGHSMLVTDGIQRARMRCADDSECFLTPGEPVEVTVDLWSTALVFNRGHRIRILVAGSNWPRFEVNPNHGGELNGDDPAVTARPQILFGPDYPSHLELPRWEGPLAILTAVGAVVEQVVDERGTLPQGGKNDARHTLRGLW